MKAIMSANMTNDKEAFGSSVPREIEKSVRETETPCISDIHFASKVSKASSSAINVCFNGISRSSTYCRFHNGRPEVDISGVIPERDFI